MMKWETTQYGSGAFCVLAGGLRISVNWWEGGYKVQFVDWRLKNTIRGLDEAKVAGLKLARKKLELALAELTELEIEVQS